MLSLILMPEICHWHQLLSSYLHVKMRVTTLNCNSECVLYPLSVLSLFRDEHVLHRERCRRRPEAAQPHVILPPPHHLPLQCIHCDLAAIHLLNALSWFPLCTPSQRWPWKFTVWFVSDDNLFTGIRGKKRTADGIFCFFFHFVRVVHTWCKLSE